MSLASKNSSGSLGSRESNQQRHPKVAPRFDSTPKLPNSNQVINLKLKNGKESKIMSVKQFEKIAISQNDYPLNRGKQESRTAVGEPEGTPIYDPYDVIKDINKKKMPANSNQYKLYSSSEIKPKQERIQQKQLMINRARMSLNTNGSKARNEDLACFVDRPIEASEGSSHQTSQGPFNASPYATNEKHKHQHHGGALKHSKNDSEPKKSRIPDVDNVDSLGSLLINEEIQTPQFSGFQSIKNEDERKAELPKGASINTI